MKILCIIDSLISGGAQRQIVELAIGFKKKGNDVTLLTYYDNDFFKSHLDANFIVVKTIIEPNYIKRLFKMRKAIRKERPDAVLAFLDGSCFIATFASLPFKSWKLILGERNAKPELLTSLKAKGFRVLHIFADYVVANSKANIQLVEQINPFISQKKFRVIYNIVSLANSFPKKQVEESNDYTSLLKIVVAARYDEQKNLDGLIEAVNLLPTSYKEKILINWYGRKDVGNKILKSGVTKIHNYKLQGQIVLNDATKLISEKYLEADYVGLFSHYEGFPNTICEAMALSKPVIVSDVSDIPFFIKENQNGFLCHSNDVESIKNALIKAIDSTEEQRNCMGINNYKFAIKEFNSDRIVNEYLSLLNND